MKHKLRTFVDAEKRNFFEIQSKTLLNTLQTMILSSLKKVFKYQYAYFELEDQHTQIY